MKHLPHLPLLIPRPYNEFYDVKDDVERGYAWLSPRDGICDARHDYLSRPALILEETVHPNIERFFGTRHHEGKVFAKIRLPTRGHLRTYLKNVQNVDHFSIALQLAYGLVYLHTHNPKKAFVVVHGNVHPTNVLMHDGIPVLSNFALCSSSLSADLPGVPDDGHLTYKAPELLQGQGDHAPVRTPETDVYAFGMLLYELFAGEEPFKGVPPAVAAQRVLNGTRPPRGALLRDAFGDAIWNIIANCWKQQPLARCNAEAIRDALLALTQI